MVHLNQKKSKWKMTPRHIFCYVTVILVIGHWLFFTLFEQVSAIVSVFSGWDIAKQEYYIYPFDKLFTNFTNVFTSISSDPAIRTYYLRGIFVYLLDVPTFLIPIFVAFILYKKVPLANFWIIVLFLPSAFSSLMITMSFKYFVDSALIGIIYDVTGRAIPSLIHNENTAFWFLIFYKEYFGIGAGLIVNIGTLRKIPEDIIDYGRLEGLTMWQEFIYVAIPAMYNLISLTYMGVLSGLVFGSDLPLYGFYAERAYDYNVVTLGYYMLTNVLGQNGAVAEAMYGYQQAWAYIQGLIGLALTMLGLKIFNKFDPKWEI